MEPHTAIPATLEHLRGEDGDGLLDHLVPAVYGELKRLARRRLGRPDSRPGQLDTTSLVHEAYLKLLGRGARFENRRHFFSVAAKAMRQIVVDEARYAAAAKRGGVSRPVTLDENTAGNDPGAPEIVALDEALGRLENLAPRLAQVVELRFFVGWTEEEIGDHLGLTSRTVRRDWTKARAWLHRELRTASE